MKFKTGSEKSLFSIDYLKFIIVKDKGRVNFLKFELKWE